LQKLYLYQICPDFFLYTYYIPWFLPQFSLYSSLSLYPYPFRPQRWVVGRLLFLRQTRISVSRKIQFGGQIIKRKKTRSTKHFVSWWIVTGHKKQKSTFCYNNPIVIFYFVILRSMVEGAGSTDIALCVNQLTIPLTIWPSGWVLIFFNIPPSPIPSTISVHPFRQRRKIFVFFFSWIKTITPQLSF
jgi:hypothetical protein